MTFICVYYNNFKFKCLTSKFLTVFIVCLSLVLNCLLVFYCGVSVRFWSFCFYKIELNRYSSCRACACVDGRFRALSSSNPCTSVTDVSDAEPTNDDPACLLNMRHYRHYMTTATPSVWTFLSSPVVVLSSAAKWTSQLTSVQLWAVRVRLKSLCIHRLAVTILVALL